jgi:hypothetical protein
MKIERCHYFITAILKIRQTENIYSVILLMQVNADITKSLHHEDILNNLPHEDTEKSLTK